MALRDWLPDVLQAAKPWLSATDIAVGTRWSTDVADRLKETRVGILCLTPENLQSKWLHFEAGALAKTIEQTYVCPYLFRLDFSDLTGPLAQFQATRADVEGSFKLVQSVNAALGAQGLDDQRLAQTFRRLWGELEQRLQGVPVGDLADPPVPRKNEREILEEVLDLVRGISARDSEMLRALPRPTAEHLTSASSVFRSQIVGTHRQLTVPQEMLKQLRLTPGDFLEFTVEGGRPVSVRALKTLPISELTEEDMEAMRPTDKE